MRRRLFVNPWCGTFLRSLILVCGAFAASGAFAQTNERLTAISPVSQTARPGPIALTARVLFSGGLPAPNQRVTWSVVSTTAGASGGGVRFTDSGGYSVGQFKIPRSGRTSVRANFAPASGGAPQSVDFEIVTQQSTVPPPTGGISRVDLAPAGPVALALVLGDRGAVAVRTSAPGGQPVPGLAVRFAVESSPGSPGVGRSDQTVTTGSDGVASATFGFSTAGRTTIRVTVVEPGVDAEPDSILFTVDTSSLGALTPERQTWRTAAEALDAVCLDVFVDEQGRPRPEPQPTPLCVYMTGTLTNQEDRAAAIQAMSPTGLASQGTVAITGVTQLKNSVLARLAALRGGAVRGAVDQIALRIDDVELTSDLVVAAAAHHGRGTLDRRLDEAFARLYGRLDAQRVTAQEPIAVEPRRERRWGLFATGRLTSGEHPSGVEVDAFDFDTAGLTVGADRAISANGFLGLALTNLRNETELAGNGGELEADALAATLYGIREGEKGYAQAIFTYGRTAYDQERRLPMPALGDLTARADFDGDQMQADLEAGRSVDGRAGSLTFFVRGSWARASIDGFRETGAVADLPGPAFGEVDFGLEVDAQDVESLLGAAGLDWGKAYSVAGGLVIPQITAYWWHDFSDDADPVQARFLGDVAAGSSFFTFADAPDGDWLTAGAALRFQYLWGSFFVAYDRWFLRDDLDLSNVNVGLRFEL